MITNILYAVRDKTTGKLVSDLIADNIISKLLKKKENNT